MNWLVLIRIIASFLLGFYISFIGHPFYSIEFWIILILFCVAIVVTQLDEKKENKK